MDTKTIFIALGALIIGGTLGFLFSPEKTSAPDEHMMDAMGGMMAGLEGKSGDEFDRVFIEGMIVHHQGAVAMAEALLANTQRPELHQLGNDIISAQTREIEMMRQWKAAWYPSN